MPDRRLKLNSIDRKQNEERIVTSLMRKCGATVRRAVVYPPRFRNTPSLLDRNGNPIYLGYGDRNYSLSTN